MAVNKLGHRPFESKTRHGSWTKICDDMMDSKAWQSLSRSQRCLYLELKRKFTAKVVNGKIISDNAKDISMPTSEATKLYSNLRLFRTDIDALINCGFIDCIRGGYTTRTANIYGFSDRWIKYGQPDYEVSYKVARPQRMKKKETTVDDEPERDT